MVGFRVFVRNQEKGVFRRGFLQDVRLSQLWRSECQMYCWGQYLGYFFVSLAVTLDSTETPFAKTPFSWFLILGRSDFLCRGHKILISKGFGTTENRVAPKTRNPTTTDPTPHSRPSEIFETFRAAALILRKTRGSFRTNRPSMGALSHSDLAPSKKSLRSRSLASLNCFPITPSHQKFAAVGREKALMEKQSVCNDFFPGWHSQVSSSALQRCFLQY